MTQQSDERQHTLVSMNNAKPTVCVCVCEHTDIETVAKTTKSLLSLKMNIYSDFILLHHVDHRL